MSYRGVGGPSYSYNVNKYSQDYNRNTRRQANMALKRAFNESMSMAHENRFRLPRTYVAPTTVPAGSAGSVEASSGTVNLPVPAKKRKVLAVNKRNIVREVQALKNKVNKQELKSIGIGFANAQMLFYTDIVPSRTDAYYYQYFHCQPVKSGGAHAPVLPQGVTNGSRIGDKVYFISARFRMVIRIDPTSWKTLMNDKTAIFPLTYTLNPANPYPASAGTIQRSTNYNMESFGLSVPIRIVSLAIREDYLLECVGANNRHKLVLSDIFTHLASYDGTVGTTPDNDKNYLFSRKVRNEAAGKVRIKTDNVEYISCESNPSGCFVFDKNVPIRQEYSYEVGKTGWVHGVLFYVPRRYELERYVKGTHNIGWNSFSTSDAVLRMDGCVTYYYYDA